MVPITAAAGGGGNAAVQIAVAVGAHVVAVASPPNHDYLLGLGASEVLRHHAAGRVQQVRAVIPSGADLLFDGAGGQTLDQTLDVVRDSGRAIPHRLARHPLRLEWVSPANHSLPMAAGRHGQLTALVDASNLRAQAGTVLPLGQAREALARVAARHTRGKIALHIG